MTSAPSEDQLIHDQGVERVPDLVHQVRGLNFFGRHASRGMAAIAAREGIAVTVDRPKLSRAFIDWVADLNSQKDLSDVNRRDYIAFGAGLLLRRLLEGEVLQAPPSAPPPGDLVPDMPLAAFWPQGYVATSYCLTVLDTVFRQEGLPPLHLQDVAGDIRTWWSFRENVADDPRLAIPFLDLMIGNDPNWTFPAAASERGAIRASLGHEPSDAGRTGIA